MIEKEYFTEQEIYENIMSYYDYTVLAYDTVRSMIIGAFGREVFLEIEPPSSITTPPMQFGYFTGTKVVINLYNIMKRCTKDIIDCVILYIVIHELYHTTQNVNAYRYDNDTWYRDTIESSCDWCAWKFIYANKNILTTLLGIDIDMDSLYDYFYDPVLRINYMPQMDPSAEYWTNTINSLASKVKDGLYNIGNMRQMIEDADVVILEFRKFGSESKDTEFSQFIKFKGEYFLIDSTFWSFIRPIADSDSIFQCQSSSFKDDTYSSLLFTIFYGYKYNDTPNAIPRPLIKNYNK